MLHGCVFAEVSGLRDLLGAVVLAYEPPMLRGVALGDTVTSPAIFTGTENSLLGTVRCFITRSAGTYRGYTVYTMLVLFLRLSINL